MQELATIKSTPSVLLVDTASETEAPEPSTTESYNPATTTDGLAELHVLLAQADTTIADLQSENTMLKLEFKELPKSAVPQEVMLPPRTPASGIKKHKNIFQKMVAASPFGMRKKRKNAMSSLLTEDGESNDLTMSDSDCDPLAIENEQKLATLLVEITSLHEKLVVAETQIQVLTSQYEMECDQRLQNEESLRVVMATSKDLEEKYTTLESASTEKEAGSRARLLEFEEMLACQQDSAQSLQVQYDHVYERLTQTALSLTSHSAAYESIQGELKLLSQQYKMKVEEFSHLESLHTATGNKLLAVELEKSVLVPQLQLAETEKSYITSQLNAFTLNNSEMTNQLQDAVLENNNLVTQLRTVEFELQNQLVCNTTLSVLVDTNATHATLQLKALETALEERFEIQAMNHTSAITIHNNLFSEKMREYELVKEACIKLKGDHFQLESYCQSVIEQTRALGIERDSMSSQMQDLQRNLTTQWAVRLADEQHVTQRLTQEKLSLAQENVSLGQELEALQTYLEEFKEGMTVELGKEVEERKIAVTAVEKLERNIELLKSTTRSLIDEARGTGSASQHQLEIHTQRIHGLETELKTLTRSIAEHTELDEGLQQEVERLRKIIGDQECEAAATDATLRRLQAEKKADTTTAITITEENKKLQFFLTERREQEALLQKTLSASQLETHRLMEKTSTAYSTLVQEKVALEDQLAATESERSAILLAEAAVQQSLRSEVSMG